ncbi:unnamed protein product [Diplocarpon coronariae]
MDEAHLIKVHTLCTCVRFELLLSINAARVLPPFGPTLGDGTGVPGTLPVNA